MKKTLTVNLGGTVFQIDEDAYNLLDNYLNNLRFHFRNEAEGEEIVRDMEMRISELFTEGMEGGQQVITIDNVEAVIARMGRPEELDDDGESCRASGHAGAGYASADEAASGANSYANEAAGEGTETRESETKGADKKFSTCEEVKKRLFRDVDHQVLGGVLAGIAAYFGWDPTALRLVFILLGFLPGGPSVLLIYLVLLFIIPPARTATEKLQMRGEPINMENIGKTVTDGFERMKHTAKANCHRTGPQRFLDGLVNIVGILLKGFLIFLVICCIPFLIAGFIALFSLIMSAFGCFIHFPSFCCHLMPNVPWHSLMSYPVAGIFFLLSALLIVGIPLQALAQVILQHYGYSKQPSTASKLTLLLVWLVALIAGFVLFFQLSTLG